MTAPADLVFDIDPPRRPGPDDVDATLIDDPRPGVPAPKAGMPYAAQLNQGLKLAKALGGMAPVAMIEIWFSAGTPFVKYVVALRSELAIVDLTVTPNADGDTTITWAADTLPTSTSSPDAHICEFGSWLAPVAENVTNGFRVQTKNSAGVLTDAKVKVFIY